MADEITKVELFGQNRDGDTTAYTCASLGYWSKGTLLVLTDPRTISARTVTTPVTAPIVGIASMDKTYDFSTRASVWDNGIFEGTASGTIVIGTQVIGALGGVNRLSSGVANPLGSQAAVVGWALEAASDGETFTFRRKGIGG